MGGEAQVGMRWFQGRWEWQDLDWKEKGPEKVELWLKRWTEADIVTLVLDPDLVHLNCLVPSCYRDIMMVTEAKPDTGESFHESILTQPPNLLPTLHCI